MSDNNALINKILRAVVDSICPIDPTAPVPALSQTQASSMNVAVNNFIPDSIGWRKPNTDHGWSSWNHSSWEVRALEHMEDARWKHSDDGRDAWSWGGHAGHTKQQKDKWSNGRGKPTNGMQIQRNGSPRRLLMPVPSPLKKRLWKQHRLLHLSPHAATISWGSAGLVVHANFYTPR